MFILKYNMKIRKSYNKYKIVKKRNIDNMHHIMNYFNFIKKTIFGKKFKPFILYDIKKTLENCHYVEIPKNKIRHIDDYFNAADKNIYTSIPVYDISDNSSYFYSELCLDRSERLFCINQHIYENEMKQYTSIDMLENIKKCEYLKTDITYYNIDIVKDISDICKNNGIFLQIGQKSFFISDNKKIIAKLKLKL